MEEGGIQKKGEELVQQSGPSDLLRRLEEIGLEVHRMEIQKIEQQLRIDQIRDAFQKQIEELRSRPIELYDSAPVGYFTLDLNGFIVEVNRTGAELLGIAKTDLIKTPFSLYVAEEDRPAFEDYRTRLFTTEGLQSGEIRLVKKD